MIRRLLRSSDNVYGSVQIGNRYRETGDYDRPSFGAPAVWIVENISEVPASRYPIVKIRREGHLEISKSLSAFVFVDGASFALASRADQGESGDTAIAASEEQSRPEDGVGVSHQSDTAADTANLT